VTQPKPAQPIRIKLYGLFPTTKRRYVVQVVVAAVLMAFLLITSLALRNDLRTRTQPLGVPLLDMAAAFWNMVPWIVAVVAVLQVVEAYFVFRAFARKRAEAPPAPPPETPPAPPAEAPPIQPTAAPPADRPPEGAS
jgi:hypothetical protein